MNEDLRGLLASAALVTGLVVLVLCGASIAYNGGFTPNPCPGCPSQGPPGVTYTCSCPGAGPAIFSVADPLFLLVLGIALLLAALVLYRKKERS